MEFQFGYRFPYIEANGVLTKTVCHSKEPILRAIKYSGIGVVLAFALDIIIMLGVLIANALIFTANLIGLHLFLGPSQPQPNICFGRFA